MHSTVINVVSFCYLNYLSAGSSGLGYLEFFIILVILKDFYYIIGKFAFKNHAFPGFLYSIL
jgi:uncharacterized RDD family membrane protein YckC